MLSNQDKTAIVTKMAKMLLNRGSRHGAYLVRPVGLPLLGASPDAPRPRSKVVEVVGDDGVHTFYDTEGRQCLVADESEETE